MRLLIVEDDNRAARYLLRGLTESGHVVDHAAEGETGLALALEGIYDALIVDRRLPVLDGLTLVRRLRRTRRRDTGADAERHRQHSRQGGGHAGGL